MDAVGVTAALGVGSTEAVTVLQRDARVLSDVRTLPDVLGQCVAELEGAPLRVTSTEAQALMRAQREGGAL